MLAAVLLLNPDPADYRRDPRLPPEPPRLPPPDDLGEEEPPLETRGELARGDGELARGEGLLGADGRLMRGELWLLDCRLTRGEGDGLERISGTGERAGEEGAVARGIRLGELEESDRPTLLGREDPRSTCGVERSDEFLSTLDSERAGADSNLEERLSRLTGPLSIELFRGWTVPRSEDRVVPVRCGADVVAREPRTEPPRSTLLLRGCNLPLLLRSGAE